MATTRRCRSPQRRSPTLAASCPTFLDVIALDRVDVLGSDIGVAIAAGLVIAVPARRAVIADGIGVHLTMTGASQARGALCPRPASPSSVARWLL